MICRTGDVHHPSPMINDGIPGGPFADFEICTGASYRLLPLRPYAVRAAAVAHAPICWYSRGHDVAPVHAQGHEERGWQGLNRGSLQATDQGTSAEGTSGMKAARFTPIELLEVIAIIAVSPSSTRATIPASTSLGPCGTMAATTLLASTAMSSGRGTQ